MYVGKYCLMIGSSIRQSRKCNQFLIRWCRFCRADCRRRTRIRLCRRSEFHRIGTSQSQCNCHLSGKLSKLYPSSEDNLCISHRCLIGSTRHRTDQCSLDLRNCCSILCRWCLIGTFQQCNYRKRMRLNNSSRVTRTAGSVSS